MKFDLKEFIHAHKDAEFIRFVFVGFSNFLVSFTIYYLVYKFVKVSTVLYQSELSIAQAISAALYSLGIKSFDGAFANICGYCAGTVNSFIWNKIWTFKAKYQTVTQFRKFIFLNILSLTLSTSGILIFVDHMGGPYKLVWFIVGICTTALNFLGYKFWVFKEKELPKQVRREMRYAGAIKS